MSQFDKPRMYVDTSVFGGVFDSEFSVPSQRLFELIEKDAFTLVTSAVVNLEIEKAPDKVRKLFNKMADIAEVIEVTEDTENLQEAYLEAKIVTEKYSEDALHVALATVSRCSMIISWNFKHIVSFQKIPLYNAVNQLHGYSPLQIFSPLEVIEHD